MCLLLGQLRRRGHRKKVPAPRPAFPISSDQSSPLPRPHRCRCPRPRQAMGLRLDLPLPPPSQCSRRLALQIRTRGDQCDREPLPLLLCPEINWWTRWRRLGKPGSGDSASPGIDRQRTSAPPSQVSRIPEASSGDPGTRSVRATECRHTLRSVSYS